MANNVLTFNRFFIGLGWLVINEIISFNRRFDVKT